MGLSQAVAAFFDDPFRFQLSLGRSAPLCALKPASPRRCARGEGPLPAFVGLFLLYSIGIIGYCAGMISQKARYALRALLYLAARGDDAPVQIAEIAEAEKIPRKFLEAILLELKKTGIVRSHRGRSGGYSLGRPAKDISFADVLRVTDGPLALSPCVSVMAYRKCDDCFDEAVCGIRKALLAARDATAEVLESRSLAAAAAQMRRSGAL